MMTLPDFKYKQCIFYFSSKEKSHLKFKLDNITISDETGKIVQQHSCHRIFVLCIIGNISFTSVVMKQAKKFGFPVLFMSRNMKLEGYLNNRAEGNFLLRRKQYQHRNSLAIAKELVSQKINNQILLLKQLRYKSQKLQAAIAVLTAYAPEKAVDDKQLLGIEGNASRVFFKHYFDKLNWKRREPRVKRDIPNLLMDIGYTYLFNFIEAMTAIYGFDIYCGVYHKFFYQRKSLICDLVEPFRCIVDQRVRKAYNLKQINEEDFFVSQGQYKLSYKKQAYYTKFFVKDILACKEEIFLYIQSYYRWFMKDKSFADFPRFRLGD